MSEKDRSTFRELGHRFVNTFRDSAIQGLMDRRKELSGSLTVLLIQVRGTLLFGAFALLATTLLMAAAATALAEILDLPAWIGLLYFAFGFALAAAIIRFFQGRTVRTETVTEHTPVSLRER